ncbi:MAG: DUF305 domain-containing protein [Gemmatimonadales bacterium]|nr:DUF305 domain-containing protein [Gemmatimonadales bacterium]
MTVQSALSRRLTLALLLLAPGPWLPALGAQVGVIASPKPAEGTPEELARIAKARRDSAKARYTDADVAFMTGMIGHHQQAILISEWAPTHGAGPAVRRLAARIINAQNDEITVMREWLRERGKPVPGGDHDHAAMDHGGHGDHGLMPGMLSEAQLRQLDAARGADFDRLFLTFMIQHHQGATHMVKTLFATDGAGQENLVFKFASDVNVDQTTEINRMQLMLDGLPPTAGAP